MRKRIFIIVVALIAVSILHAQEAADLTVSGYIQTQWTWDEKGVSDGTQNNFSIRRGRVKLAYSNKYGELVAQIDATENGVSVKDAYMKLKKPDWKWIALQAGIFNRPFGYEIAYSSSQRESPERSRVFLALFPKERDLGAALILKGTSGLWQHLSLNAGIFTGNGGQDKETDSGKDFIAHLAYTQQFKSHSLGVGASLYAGGVRLGGDESQHIYKVKDKAFVVDASLTQGAYTKRLYYGVDIQYSVYTLLGRSTLMGEFLCGTQPGLETHSKSPTGVVVADIYSRTFMGYYGCLVQDVGRSKHSLVLKYDRYNPNIHLSGNDCLTEGDISFSTVGFGWLYRINPSCRLTCFYELTANEKVANDNPLATYYAKDRADDLFTLRLQYKF